ncbi:MAG: hypothetical protein V3U31_01090 [Dehalococcoidia bacterium]
MPKLGLTKMRKWLFVALALPLVLPGVASAQAAPGLTLPDGAECVGEAVPAMGDHCFRPQDMPIGPMYVVWQGKVIGLEYFFAPSLMGRVEIPTPAGPVTFFQLENLDIFGQKVDHISVNYIYPGVGGFEDGIYAVHLWFITPEERYQIVFPQAVPSPVATTAPITPWDAIKVTDVIPAMGEHWIVPGGWPWGPTYMMYNRKLIGVEFEFNHDVMRGSKMVTPEGELFIYDLGLIQVGHTLDHMNIEYLPSGHEGMGFWHFAIHMYNITPQERGQVLPGG